MQGGNTLDGSLYLNIDNSQMMPVPPPVLMQPMQERRHFFDQDFASYIGLNPNEPHSVYSLLNGWTNFALSNDRLVSTCRNYYNINMDQFLFSRLRIATIPARNIL